MKSTCIYVMIGIVSIATSLEIRTMQRESDRQRLERAIGPARERVVGRPTEAAPSRQSSERPRRRVVFAAEPVQPEVSPTQQMHEQERPRVQEERKEMMGELEQLGRPRQQVVVPEAAAESAQSEETETQRAREQWRRRMQEQRLEQQQERKEEMERLRQDVEQLEVERLQLREKAARQEETRQHIERRHGALVAEQESLNARMQEQQREQRRLAAMSEELVGRKSLFELKEEQKERLPNLLKNLMEPLFTALTVMNDKGARRNLRKIIKNFIKEINKGLPTATGQISEDNPDTIEVTPMLLTMLRSDRRLLHDVAIPFVDLLDALHAGDLQQAIHIAQTAYGGSSSLGGDFTFKKFEQDYQKTLAGIVLQGMFERGLAFEPFLEEPRGNLWMKADAMMASREQQEEEQYVEGLEKLGAAAEETESLI